jgi:diacylglycerol kinase
MRPRTWKHKFGDAFRGLKRGVRGQSSFFVHFFMAAAVVAAAWVLRADRLEWCLLILCIAIVLAAEMFNSALERVAKAVDRHPDDHLRDALDIGSGAVLLAALGAAVVGTIVLAYRLGVMLDWW